MKAEYTFVYEPVVYDGVDTEYANEVLREAWARRERMAKAGDAKGEDDGR